MIRKTKGFLRGGKECETDRDDKSLASDLKNWSALVESPRLDWTHGSFGNVPPRLCRCPRGRRGGDPKGDKESGRIVPNAAGLIDPDQADANWWRYSQRNPQTYAAANSSIAWRRPGAAWLAGVDPRGAIAPAQSACQNAEPVLYSRRRGFGAALERDRSGAAGQPEAEV